MKRNFWIAGALLLLAGCSGGAGTSPGTNSRARRLVCDFDEEFGSFGKRSSIFSILPDGTGKTRLTSPTRTEDTDFQPDLNAAGTEVVFTSSRNAGPNSYNIWKVSTAGGAPVQLTTNNPGSFPSPRWSPDGKRIVFTRDDGSNSDVFLMNSDGTMQINLTPNTPQSDETDPDFSPDGKRVVFSSTRRDLGNGEGSTYRQIYSMKLDGSDVKQMTSSRAYANHPHYSPDGKSIAYSVSGSPFAKIIIINADGSAPRTIFEKDFSYIYDLVEFSADGREIFYVSEDPQPPANGVALLAISISDGKQRRITRLFEGAISVGLGGTVKSPTSNARTRPSASLRAKNLSKPS